MEIVIERVAALTVGSRVAFGCECGRAEGFWVGEMPVVGERYTVELGIEKPVSIGDNCIETILGVGIRMEGDIACVVGEVVETWCGGTAFRLDCGCGALDLEVAHGQVALWRRYELRTQELKLYDCNY